MPTTLVGLTLAAALPIIFVGGGLMVGRGAFDQFYFHEPTIRAFARALPSIDLRDYFSATTPGFHLVLAVFARVVDSTRQGLQLAGLGFSLGLVGLLGWALERSARGAGRSVFEALGLGTPFVCSIYVFLSAVWLLPDNAGWLGVLALLLLALRPAYRWVDAMVMGLVLSALVFTRQSHLWAAAVVWAWAWLSAGPFDRWSWRQLMARPVERGIALCWGIASTLPAFAIVGGLARLWGGLTPPHFHAQHNAGVNPATPAFALALTAVYSCFLIAYLGPTLLRLWREQRRLLLIAGGIGALLAIAPATTYLFESRSTGLWNLVKLFDQRGIVFAGRTSPVIVILGTVGAVCVVGWLAMLGPRRRLIALVALLAFIVAQSANSNAWQRYLEPMLLMALALIAASSPAATSRASSSRRERALGVLRIAGPMALALALAGVTAMSIIQGDPIGP